MFEVNSTYLDVDRKIKSIQSVIIEQCFFIASMYCSGDSYHVDG